MVWVASGRARVVEGSGVLIVASWLLFLVTVLPTSDPDGLPAAIDPDDPEQLLAHAEALKKDGSADGHLAYLIRALDATERLEMDDETARRAAIRALEAKIGAADRASKGLLSALQKYNVELAEVLRLYGRNPQRTRNALEIAGRILAFDPEHGTANQVIADLLKDADESLQQDAARALARRDLRRTRSYRAAWNQEHGSWDEPGIARTDGYYVRSTIGFSALERAANALEQVSHFYRTFYGVRPKGRQFGRTKVWLYRTREEFERLSPMSGLTAKKTVRGFLQTTYGKGLPAFGLYSYDPLDDGMARGNLWETLFHEASHQYMALAAGGGTPAWLNEGMACYFEGAFLDRNNEVQVGLPAAGRLRYLTHVLGRNPLKRTLEAQDGLDAAQYPVAWGIVYFLHEYQTEEGDWPYRDALRQAIELSGGRRSEPFGIFEKAVLEPRGLEFAALNRDWAGWITGLAERERDPVGAAQWYRERAERFEAAEKFEAAREAYHQLRMRAPEDANPLLALARMAAAGEDEDHTLTLARRALAEAERVGDGAVEKAAEALARSIDRAGFVRLSKAETKYREQIRRQVRRHLKEGRPMTAYAVADRFLDRVLGESHAASVARTVGTGQGSPISRVLAPFDGETRVGLICAPEAFRVEQGALVGAPAEDRPVAVFVEDPVAPVFRFEGEVLARDADSVVGFVVTRPDTLETLGFATRPAGGISRRTLGPPFGEIDLGEIAPLRRGSRKAKAAFHVTGEFELDEASESGSPLEAGAWSRFALELGGDGRLRLSVSGEIVATTHSAGSTRDLTIGILVCTGEASLRNLRIVEHGRL